MIISKANGTFWPVLAETSMYTRLSFLAYTCASSCETCRLGQRGLLRRHVGLVADQDDHEVAARTGDSFFDEPVDGIERLSTGDVESQQCSNRSGERRAYPRK